MSSHEMARRLLELPDLPVVLDDAVPDPLLVLSLRQTWVGWRDPTTREAQAGEAILISTHGEPGK